MPSQADLDSFARLQLSGPDTSAQTIMPMPKLEDHAPELVKRYPGILGWQRAVEEWRVKTNIALRAASV